jgi:hypothetical protein
MSHQLAQYMYRYSVTVQVCLLKLWLLWEILKLVYLLTVVGVASHYLQSPSQGYKIDKKEMLLQTHIRLRSQGGSHRL